MQGAVRERGYTLLRGGILPQRTPWLAPRSTIFFYDAAVEPDARRLAAVLQARTGAAFDVVQGGGLGVSATQQRNSLRVHFVAP